MNSTEEARYLNLSSSYETSRANVDMMFLVLMASNVLLMQAGFAMLEAGAVRSKNVVNILAKNMADLAFGGIAFWICGFAFAFGDGSSFIGFKYFIAWGLAKSEYAYMFFQATFAATCVTIVSGSIAERSNFNGYIVFACFITGFIYPVQVHWGWGPGGWLAMRGFHDYAGSGLVHLAGGTCSFVACFIIGPRRNRFKFGRILQYPGHSFPLVCLGYFILIFGFLGFNGGSRGSITSSGDGEIVSLVIFGTLISCCSGTIVVLFIQRFRTGYWKMISAINGGLIGMVSVCCGCDGFYPWSACLTGAVAGIVYLLLSKLMEVLRMDDPLDAIAVHAGGGLWGLIAGPLFHVNGVFSVNPSGGINMLLWNLVGMVAIIAWVATCSIILFFALRRFGILRVSEECEITGLDAFMHEDVAYPEWTERCWYKSQPGISNIVYPLEAAQGRGNTLP